MLLAQREFRKLMNDNVTVRVGGDGSYDTFMYEFNFKMPIDPIMDAPLLDSMERYLYAAYKRKMKEIDREDIKSLQHDLDKKVEEYNMNYGDCYENN